MSAMAIAVSDTQVEKLVAAIKADIRCRTISPPTIHVSHMRASVIRGFSSCRPAAGLWASKTSAIPTRRAARAIAMESFRMLPCICT